MNIKLNLTTEEHNNVIAAIQAQAEDLGYDENETLEDMIQIVDSALEAMGIECIWDDDDEDFDEEEEYDDDEEYDDEDCEEGEDSNEEVYRLTPKGEFVAHLLECGINYDNALLWADMFYDKNGELKSEYQAAVPEATVETDEYNPWLSEVYEKNGQRVISMATANELLNTFRQVVADCCSNYTVKEQHELVVDSFIQFCETVLKISAVDTSK